MVLALPPSAGGGVRGPSTRNGGAAWPCPPLRAPSPRPWDVEVRSWTPCVHVCVYVCVLMMRREDPTG